MTLGDREYHIVMGSDVIRDGMYIEVKDAGRGADAILEVFFSDASHDMLVTLFEPNVPVEIVEWAISIARERLPEQPDRVDRCRD